MRALPGIMLLLAVSFTNFSKAQNPTASIEMVLFEMTQHNVYESASLGFAATVSAQYKRYLQVKKMATSKQLIHLATNHHNAVVRLYALKALKENKNEIPGLVEQQFSNDSSSVHIFIGCIKDVKKVSAVSALYMY